MIKKNIFEDELVSGMERELQPFVKQAFSDLEKAADYLNAAFEILEEAGLSAQSNRILNVLTKIADSKVHKLPAIQVLLDAGISEQDFEDFGSGSQFAKVKINKALKDAGYNEKQIAGFIGKNNVMTEQEIREYGPEGALNKILMMIRNPQGNVPGKSLSPGEEINIESLASQHKKPKNPLRISDPHTKGLTPEKQIKNLLHHGTQFNMADDGNDLLNLEIGDNELEILDKDMSDMDFEDEI